MTRVLVITKDMNHDDWLESRTKGIGGSDAGAICGLNPYMSAIDVYMEKTGQAKSKKINEAMRQGSDLEEYVAKRFEESTGKRVRRRNVVFQHDKYDWMIANIDRDVIGEDAILECKTASPFTAGKWKDGIPESYEIQCHHYMAVTGAAKCYLACLVLGQDFIIREILRDEEVIRNLISIELNFWENYVLKRQLPPPDGSDAAADAIKIIYADSNPEQVITLAGYEPKIQRLEEIEAMIAVLEPEKEQIKQEIMIEMGEAETAFCGDRRFSWKKQAGRVTIDSPRLKKELPDIFQKYSKVGNPFRVFKAV